MYQEDAYGAAGEAEMNEIFISYRRADSAANTGRLTSKLQEQFSPDAIFWDIPDVKVGDKYKNNIEQSLSSCKVLVAVIGPQWMGAKEDDNKERRRLDDPDDVVRNECATALRRQVHVIPVLVDGAVMPNADQLPDDLRGLTDFNAAPFSERTWNDDFEKLAAKLQDVTKLKRRTIEGSRAAGLLHKHTRRHHTGQGCRRSLTVNQQDDFHAAVEKISQARRT